MSDWRLARSLVVLGEEVNRRFPNRSKASDGTIGDADHSSRTSDHNPNSAGVVCARDITEDDAPGVPEIADFIVATIVRRKDRRVKYLIHEGRIWRSYDKPGIPAWTSAPYDGPNGHFKHVHVSVGPDAGRYDSTAGWGIYPPPTRSRPVGTPLWFYRTLRHQHPHMTGGDVAALQKALFYRGILAREHITGVYDHEAMTAVDRFRRSVGMTHGTVFDTETARKLQSAR